MDVCSVIKKRLQELQLEQRDLAAAAGVTESYISQLLTRRKSPPAADRTDLYDRMNEFLELPKGQLSAMAKAQHAEALKKKLADPPHPLFKEVRSLVIEKCSPKSQRQFRTIFELQEFGELERLITQKLLDVAKKIAKDELQDDGWLRAVAKTGKLSYEETRGAMIEFLDTDVFDLSLQHCSLFLEPLIESWNMDLTSFAIEITLNRRLAPVSDLRFEFVETASVDAPAQCPGFLKFLNDQSLSGDASPEELQFLAGLRFISRVPNALYFYRELQNLRDPLHFPGNSVSPLRKFGDSNSAGKKLGIGSRKRALRRWNREQHPASKQS